MLKISAEILSKYSRFVVQNGIPRQSHCHYEKWLRYYLDFCHKYQHIAEDTDSLATFVRKLHEKNQSMYQQKQASHAIKLYYELIGRKTSLLGPSGQGGSANSLEYRERPTQASAGLAGMHL